MFKSLKANFTGFFYACFYQKIFPYGELKGKRIAIVGPADSVFKAEKGNYIDQFDYVVRINKAALVIEDGKFPNFIGTKTDILFHSFYENEKSGGGPLDFDRFKKLGIQYIINPLSGYWGFRFSYNYYKRYLRKEIVYRVPRGLFHGLLRIFKPFRPTTGFYALKFVMESEFSELYITGFTFFKTAYIGGYRDHVKEVAANTVFIKEEKQHDPDLEFEQFKVLLEKHKGKQIHLDSDLEQILRFN
jgi:hypothetical protein